VVYQIAEKHIAMVYNPRFRDDEHIRVIKLGAGGGHMSGIQELDYDVQGSNRTVHIFDTSAGGCITPISSCAFLAVFASNNDKYYKQLQREGVHILRRNYFLYVICLE